MRERFIAALLALQPLGRPADAELTKRWDDEIRNGFVRPPPDFLPSVLGTYEIYESVMHGQR